MSMVTTRDHLQALIADESVKVIALSGKWGTGKSFMFDQIHKSANAPGVKKALYASLFGLSTIDQVKLKLMQSSVELLDGGGSKKQVWVELGKKLAGTVVKRLETLHKGLGVINDLGILAAPALLRGKLIVLDDLERKHDRLDIEEILGFIDEYTQRFEARVLLILNTDRLKKRDIWDTLREKVVDQELRLTTTPDEALNIALLHVPSRWAEAIRPAIAKCEISNIRIISKILTVVNKVLEGRESLSNTTLARIMPSTVLLAASHYGGVEEGPDKAFILSYGTEENWSHFFEQADAIKEGHEQTDEEKLKSRWHKLLGDLGVHGSDAFELGVSDYLEAGLFGPSPVLSQLDTFERHGDGLRLAQAIDQLYLTWFWEHGKPDAESIEAARPLVADVHLVDAVAATSLHDTLLLVEGGAGLAEEAITRWCNAYKAEPGDSDEPEDILRRRIHPRIREKLQSAQAVAQESVTLVGACRSLAADHGIRLRDELVLRAATVDDFEHVLRHADKDDLIIVFSRMLDYLANERGYRRNFGSAMAVFLQACRKVVADKDAPKLAYVIKHLFEKSTLLHRLDEAPIETGATNPEEC